MEIRPDNRMQAVIGIRTARDIVDEDFTSAPEVSDIISGFHRVIPADSDVAAALREALRTGSWISYDIQTLEDDNDPDLRNLTGVWLDFVSPPRRPVTSEPVKSAVWAMNKNKPRVIHPRRLPEER